KVLASLPPQALHDRARARARSECAHRVVAIQVPPRAMSQQARAAPARLSRRATRSRVVRGEQLGLMLLHQRVDDLAQRLAFQDLRQLVEREIDTVIAHAPLR